MPDPRHPPPEHPPEELTKYAEDCIEDIRRAWAELSHIHLEILENAIAEAVGTFREYAEKEHKSYLLSPDDFD